jgi:spore maturation protein CgeB
MSKEINNNTKKEKLKILLVGAMQAQDIEFAYKTAFERLGCDVIAIDPQNYYSVGFLNRVLNKILNLFKAKRVFWGVDSLNQKVLEVANKINPHIVFWGKPIFIKYKTVVDLQKTGAKVFAWYPDDIFNFRNVTADMYKSISLFDCNFAPRIFAINEFLEIGARRVEFLPFAANTDLYYREKVSDEEKEKLGADIVFIGNYYENYRAEILEKLCESGYNLKVYGNRWKKFKKGKCLQVKALMFRPAERNEYRKVMNSSKIALAFLSHMNRDQHSHRGFEITACGTFLLHERGEEELMFFKEGVEAEYFSSFEELVEKIDYYLAHEEERKKIAEAGYKKAHSYECSYLARAQKIIDVYWELKEKNE